MCDEGAEWFCSRWAGSVVTMAMPRPSIVDDRTGVLVGVGGGTPLCELRRGREGERERSGECSLSMSVKEKPPLDLYPIPFSPECHHAGIPSAPPPRITEHGWPRCLGPGRYIQ